MKEKNKQYWDFVTILIGLIGLFNIENKINLIIINLGNNITI